MTNDRIVGLMETGATLLDSLDNCYGLRVGFHRDVDPGLRLLVRHHLPVTQEIGVLDRVALAVKGGIEVETGAACNYHSARGSWGESAVHVGQLVPWSDTDTPCRLTSSETAAVVRDALPLVRKINPAVLQSVHVYDAEGDPRVHLVLKSDDWRGAMRDAAAGEMLLENPPSEFSEYSAHGAVLLASGTPVTISSSS